MGDDRHLITHVQARGLAIDHQKLRRGDNAHIAQIRHSVDDQFRVVGARDSAAKAGDGWVHRGLAAVTAENRRHVAEFEEVLQPLTQGDFDNRTLDQHLQWSDVEFR
jgi:hypothetical protein